MIEDKQVGGISASETASGYFCSNLALGLHAVAQPLTIVRASLFKSYTNRMTRDELQELTRTLAPEVERVCALFGSLQQLVQIESKKPHLSELQILPLLAHAADGVELLYRKSGMFFNSVVPDSCEAVLLDRERTLEALSSVLLITHTLSHAKETVELIAASSSSTVRVIVQNTASQVNSLNAQTSLTLALAAANLRSQGAALSWSFRPFRVEMNFQTAGSQQNNEL